MVEGEVWSDCEFWLNVELICSQLHAVRKNWEIKTIGNWINKLKESWETKANLNLVEWKGVANIWIWIWILITASARLGK
jgi:hypothetical protein